MQIYPKGSYVHFDGDFIEDFMYIDKGLARFFISNEDGVEKTVYYTDRFVSIECYFHRQPTHTNCIAEEEIVLYRVKREYEDVLMERKSIRDLVVKSLAVKCRINGWQVSDLSLAKRSSASREFCVVIILMKNQIPIINYCIRKSQI